jgi:SAM-dependent methyltransferase
MTDDPWWEPLYDDLLAEVLLVRDAEDPETEATLRLLVERLDLAPGARVLDQCSGIGSLAIPLAARGFRVVAVEQCASYVERARVEAARRGVEVELHAADAFTFVPEEKVHGAFNWWTSFGYADDDADNVRMLARAFDALVPGGAFLLDVMNLPGVLRGLRRDDVVRRATSLGDVTLLRETTLDLPRGVMRKRWTYFLPDGRRVEHASRVRLHLPHQIVDMLRSVGFTDVELYGSPRGEPLGLDSPRCIARARRPR